MMEAGREMDALVAELMGWESQYIEYGGSAGEYVWVLPDGKWQHEPDVPEYSTDIAAAWLVVEKFLPHFRIECFEDSVNTDEKGWHCDIWTVRGHACAEGCDTAPLAICRAALKAIEEEA